MSVTGWGRRQWSFSKTGTVGTLASQAETDVWVQAPGRFCGRPGVSPPRNFLRLYCKILHFGQKMVRSAVHNAFLSTLTIGTAFPRVPLRNYPGEGFDVAIGSNFQTNSLSCDVAMWAIRYGLTAQSLDDNFCHDGAPIATIDYRRTT